MTSPLPQVFHDLLLSASHFSVLLLNLENHNSYIKISWLGDYKFEFGNKFSTKRQYGCINQGSCTKYVRKGRTTYEFSNSEQTKMTLEHQEYLYPQFAMRHLNFS